MQTVEKSANYIEGIFVKELKNRFLCEVLVNGVATVCYVPSSCHLSNFLDLSNKKVLLVPTLTPGSRTKRCSNQQLTQVPLFIFRKT